MTDRSVVDHGDPYEKSDKYDPSEYSDDGHSYHDEDFSDDYVSC